MERQRPWNRGRGEKRTEKEEKRAEIKARKDQRIQRVCAVKLCAQDSPAKELFTGPITSFKLISEKSQGNKKISLSEGGVIRLDCGK